MKNFLIFGLLNDIPNLFPINPSLINATTDGYGACITLLRMGYSTYPSIEISALFCCITSILVFTGFSYLGSAIFHLGSNLISPISKIPVIDEKNASVNDIV